ncbi:MAG: NAD+ synthase [Planctomycetes bacterium]|nr:NAD+ synthase [Planctomycetota bacterium]
MKIALCQIDTTVGDFEGNAAKIASFARRAKSLGADLAVFPELAIPSYPPRDLLESRGFVERSRRTLDSLLPLSREIPLVVGGLEPNPASTGKPLFNAVFLLEGGRIAGKDFKSLLPNYDVFDETRHFQPAPAPRRPVPFRGEALALTICEDAWNDRSFWPHRLYPEDPVEALVKAGAGLVLNISASPFHLGKPGFREDMLRRTARRLNTPVVLVNQVGANDELIFDGGSFAVDASGEVRARLAEFEEDIGLFDSEGDAGLLRPALSDDATAARRALVLGLRGYMRKCGFTDAVIGLSGGIDSALVAALAAEALGPSRVHGVAMPSRYSSPGSISDARAVAGNLGLDFRILPIDPLFQSYLDGLAESFRGRDPDTAEENIQARIRGNLLMALSNKFGWLVLSTGNKSELAVGYCTLYGDMSGGLAVIADVPKTLVYKVARTYGDAIPPASLTKPPSAELRPNQTDQDSLPPYEILDPVLKAYVEDGLEPEAIAARLGEDPDLVARVVHMVDRNEYKRRQAAPALKITPRAFGPGRRFPIARKS